MIQKRAADDSAEKSAGIDAFGRAMGRYRARCRVVFYSVEIWKKEHGDRSKPHDRPATRR
jgi:hypothetical protein